MKTSSAAQLAAIDRALLSLMQERAQLLLELREAGLASPGAAIEDLLRRSSGPLGADVLRAVFAALDERGAS